MKLVIFDVDGTLIDSQRMIIAAMNAAFSAHDLPAPPPAAVKAIIGLSIVPAIARLLPPDAPGGLAAVLAGSYGEAFFTLRRGPEMMEPLYPGARAALDMLAG